jgi:transcriptional regulator with XRE-family HTH domain
MMATRYAVACTDCPFTGTYASQAKADHAHRRHSCERHRQRAADTARGLARHAAIDRTPKPCLHKEADHQHGSYACYVLDLCRCLPCAAANNDYESNRLRQQAYGRWNGLVDAEPARVHVRRLMAQGMGLKRICAVSDVSQGQVWKLLYGKKRQDGSRTPSKRITPRVEANILAVRLDLADGAKIDSTGAVRRIQALVALGWSQSKIAARLGILRSNFTELAQGRTGITVVHEKAVRALYDEWSMQLPPETGHRDKIAAARSRNYAAVRGWEPPLAWDDETIDDRAAAPYMTGEVDAVYVDQAAVQRRLGGDKSVPLTRPERAEVVRRLLAQGVTKNDIERRTGINPHRESSTPQGVSA